MFFSFVLSALTEGYIRSYSARVHVITWSSVVSDATNSSKKNERCLEVWEVCIFTSSHSSCRECVAYDAESFCNSTSEHSFRPQMFLLFLSCISNTFFVFPLHSFSPARKGWKLISKNWIQKSTNKRKRWRSTKDRLPMKRRWRDWRQPMKRLNNFKRK